MGVTAVSALITGCQWWNGNGNCTLYRRQVSHTRHEISIHSTGCRHDRWRERSSARAARHRCPPWARRRWPRCRTGCRPRAPRVSRSRWRDLRTSGPPTRHSLQRCRQDHLSDRRSRSGCASVACASGPPARGRSNVSGNGTRPCFAGETKERRRMKKR